MFKSALSTGFAAASKRLLMRFVSLCANSVDEKSTKDLRHYLTNLAEQCDSPSGSSGNGENHELPYVIVLDNLHLAVSLNDVLNAVVNIKSLFRVCPYVIGTLNQQPNNSANSLQLHHNFRYVLYTGACVDFTSSVFYINRFLSF